MLKTLAMMAAAITSQPAQVTVGPERWELVGTRIEYCCPYDRCTDEGLLPGYSTGKKCAVTNDQTSKPLTAAHNAAPLAE